MVENDHPQSNPGAIEALKAATRQVVQPAENSGSLAMTSPVVHAVRGEPKQARSPVGLESKQKPQSMPVFENFAETFVKKITSIEQEKAKIEKEQLVVEQELSRVEKIQSGLFEKKKQLENRRNELIKVKDKLAALDKEISEALEFSSL